MLAGSGRRRPGRARIRWAKVSFPTHIRHSGFTTPRISSARPNRSGGLRGKSWLASPTMAVPVKSRRGNHTMSLWLCSGHLLRNNNCPLEPLPTLQPSLSPCHHHHHHQDHHQHRIPFSDISYTYSPLQKKKKLKPQIYIIHRVVCVCVRVLSVCVCIDR